MWSRSTHTPNVVCSCNRRFFLIDMLYIIPLLHYNNGVHRLSLGHRLGDDLVHVDWNSWCVRTSVRTSTKSFSDFHLIWCVGRPRPHMRTSVTSTRSKVKVKLTELPKLRKVHFSRSISSAISAWSSKLMVYGHSMGPGLQLVGARFLNFHLGKLSREFKVRPISIFDEIQMAIFR